MRSERTQPVVLVIMLAYLLSSTLFVFKEDNIEDKTFYIEEKENGMIEKKEQMPWEKKYRLMQDAAQRSIGCSSMEQLDIFLACGEEMAQGGSLSAEDRAALCQAVLGAVPEGDKKQFFQMAETLGLRVGF